MLALTLPFAGGRLAKSVNSPVSILSTLFLERADRPPVIHMLEDMTFVLSPFPCSLLISSATSPVSWPDSFLVFSNFVRACSAGSLFSSTPTQQIGEVRALLSPLDTSCVLCCLVEPHPLSVHGYFILHAHYSVAGQRSSLYASHSTCHNGGRGLKQLAPVATPPPMLASWHVATCCFLLTSPLQATEPPDSCLALASAWPPLFWQPLASLACPSPAIVPAAYTSELPPS